MFNFIRNPLGSLPATWALAVCLLLLTATLPVNFTHGAEAHPETTLRIGIFPRRSIAMTEQMHEGLRQYLATALKRPVSLETTHDFASFWENVEQQKYDLVHYNQYHYIRSHKEFGYRVIVHNEEFGHGKIAGAIVVRKDSGIESLQDLKGKKIVFGGGRSAMQAYIATTHVLRQAGLMPGDYFEQFALNPPKATIAAFYHQAAAAGAGNHVLDLPQVKTQIATEEMHYLAVSEALAHLPWAVKHDMPAADADTLQTLLGNLHQSETGRDILSQARLTRLIPCTDRDFDPHRNLVRQVLNEDY